MTRPHISSGYNCFTRLNEKRGRIVETRAELTALDDASYQNSRTQVLAWDGRLDNRDELILRLDGSLRSDRSNQSLALAAYERWGASGFVHLVGDWSVVIRDAVKRRMVLASDFAGVRPLYYNLRPEGILWSTRLESLVEATGISELDEKYAAGFFTFGGWPNRTPYKGIHSVPPGQALCVTERETVIEPFWALPIRDSIRYRNQHRYEEQLRALFQEAVAIRLQTDAPVLAELSGGLDSSSVVGMASHLIRSGSVAAPRLVSVSYIWRNSLDEPFSRDVEEFCDIEGIHLSTHDNPLITETNVGNAVPKGFELLWRSASAAARRLGARVLLTGQNGDLMMGNWWDDSTQVAAPLRHFHIVRAFQEALAWSKGAKVPISRVLWRALRTALPPALAPSASVLSDSSCVPKCAATSLLPSFSERTGLFEKDSFFSTAWRYAPPERRKHFQALAMLLELRSLQAPEPLQHLDYTHPFAHRPLVEFLMSVPADVLCGPGEPRRLMRRTFSELWPSKVRKRRSKGFFNAPWLEALRPLAKDLLKRRQIEVVERGFVDRASFVSRLQRLVAGLDCNEPQLRQIILFEFWLRQRGLKRRPETQLQAA
jgi:asparagine synthase (glutamine-hydrolysing)